MRVRRPKGFTLVEIVIVLAIISIIVAIAAPTWLRQRETSRARACQENLTKISGAVEVYAAEFRLANGSAITFPGDLVQPAGAPQGDGYLRSAVECPSGGTYSVAAVGDPPDCSIGAGDPQFPPHVLP